MKKTFSLLLLMVAYLLVPVTPAHAATGFLKIHMLSSGAGRGDCLLIELPDNTKMVVDIPDGWDNMLINRLNNLGFGGGIKYLVGTHEHSDHIGGMNNFLNSGFNINNTQIYYPKGAINANAGAYDNLVTAAGNRGLAVTKLVAGNYIVNTTYDGKPLKVRVLSPSNSRVDGGADDWDAENPASLVLKIQYGNKGILLQADTFAGQETDILAGAFANEVNNCQVIKVGHHGVRAPSGISCSGAYLDTAGVTKALITDGDKAIDATIKERLQARNIRYWSTGDGDGYCWLRTDGASAWEESEEPLWPPQPSVVAPAITDQPDSQTVNPGANVTFTVAASGTAPLGYQWMLNGVDITDANYASYTVTNAQSGDAGNYSVIVENAAGAVTSANAVLTVRVPPSITTQPVSQTVTAGANVTFAVSANGTAPLTYQWRLDGVNISGATAASLVMNNVQESDAGTYSVVVGNPAGSATSANAVLTVNVPPSITTQPTSRAVNPGASTTFTVSATGTAPLDYQWRFNGANISGATAASYTKSNVQNSDAGNYSVVINNIAGSATSANATLTVNVPPSITTQPASQTANAGANATFTVVATGTAPLSYQWTFNGVNISGATAASYTRSNVQSSHAGNYAVVVNNVAGTVTSANAVLTVNATPPSITTQPAAQTVTQGSSATFSVVATGAAPLTYQWRFNGANISGATASSYTRSNAQPSHQGNYSVVVNNAAGSVTSANAALTVKVLMILDNANPGFSVGSTNWSTGTTAVDKYGTNYRFRNTASVSDPATWSTNLANAGSYTVSAWWSQGVNRSTNAPYIVYHSTGSATVYRNQQANGGTWQSLGIYNLNAGTNRVGLSCWTTTGYVVIADAVRWQQQ